MVINIERLLSASRTTHAKLAQETHCYWCEELFNDEHVYGSNPTMDHVIPLADLGPRTAAFNLVRACGFCNGLRGHAHVYEWEVVVHDFVKPYRRDLPGMAQALAQAEGFRRYAVIVKSIAERQAIEQVEEVSIRRWSVDDAASEFNVSLKRLPNDYGINWFEFLKSMIHTVKVDQMSAATSPVWTNAGLDLKISRHARHGALLDGDLAMVTPTEWRILKTFKDAPEAVRFRTAVGDGNVYMNLLKLGRDRMGILLHRPNRTKQEAKNLFLYGTSGAAALRIHAYATQEIIHPLLMEQKEVDTRLGVPA